MLTTRTKISGTKERDAFGFGGQLIEVKSERMDRPDDEEADARLLWMRVEAEDAPQAEGPSEVEERAQTIRRHVEAAGGPVGSGDLAALFADEDGVPLSTSGNRYKPALAWALREGWIASAGRGRYGPPGGLAEEGSE